MTLFGSDHQPQGRTAQPGRPWTRRVAAVIGFTLIPGLLVPVAFAADQNTDPLGRPKAPKYHSVKLVPFTAKTDPKATATIAKAATADLEANARAREDRAQQVTWPKAGQATLTLPKYGTTRATPGTLPVTLSRPPAAPGAKQPSPATKATIRVLDQKATTTLGVKGVALAVTGPKNGGKAKLGIDYGKFVSAYGGDWAGRLQVLRLPDCALKDPSRAKCRTRTPLEFRNKRRDERLETQLSFEATPQARAAGQTMVLALAAGDKSAGGDYKATPLASSSTWEAGGSSGSFTWSYPLRTPPAAAGPEPGLSISYDSGSVDGRTANTNNQGTVIGEGFDLTSSYIERKYGPCDDDGQDDKFDLCWKYDNASLVLNGKSSELVKDDSSGKWRLKNDDASTVTRSTGADNGDDDGEHWTVITGDGTKYVFGLNKLEGADTADRTESVWTVPVFGDDEGEPGYSEGTSFAGRDLKQAWRWNLDYVEDTHTNAMTYWYKAEINYYDKLGDDDNGSAYTRGGYLEEIQYGQRKSTLFSATPAASNKVTFYYDERCVASGTGCDALTEDTRDNWPDVPFDATCKADAKCTGKASPTFFTRKRMTSVTTSAWDKNAATAAYAPVDSWALKQTYLDPGDTGDSSDQTLWLDQIRHTGKHGTDIALDPVTFDHEFRPNRVDGATDDILPLEKPRLRTISSEAGSQTIVDYMPADCVAGQTMPKADTNTRRCYPIYWSPNGEKEPILDWFHKYPVTGVRTTDPHGGSEAVAHTYSYTGGGAWHYNDDPLTKEKERTWSIWRGYEMVTHLTGVEGNAAKPQTKTVTIYMRGMNGDRVLGTDGKLPDKDARKTATVDGIKAPSITDSEQYAGFTRESVTYNGATEVGGTVNDPWSKRTATQHKSYADTEAYYVRTGATHARTNITSGSAPRDRVSTTTTSYDDYGMAATVENRGDNAIDGDERCTRTWYARNDAVGINAFVSRTRATAKPCDITGADLDLPADSATPGDVISDTATAYDTTTWSSTQAPTKGQAQWTGRAKGYTTANNPIWQKVVVTTYDTLGRPVTVKDTNDLTIGLTTYTPASSGPLTESTATNAKGHKTTTETDFATGAPTKTTDANGKITEAEYDSLGRITSVWLPNRLKVLGAPANHLYTYSIKATAPPWVSTATAKGDGNGYTTTYEIYDSLLRPRQVQSPSPKGGVLVAQTLHDNRGLAVTAQSDVWNASLSPAGKLVTTDGGQFPAQTDTTYDGAGRPVTTETKTGSTPLWTTETRYTGDTVSTSAPAGGQASAVVTNALGQTTERREFAGTQPTAGTSFITTRYTYTPSGQQETVTGPDQAKWSYTYDLFGRQSSASDPDKGKATTAYDDLDQPASTTDVGRNKKLLFEYDVLGRKTGLWDATKSDGAKLAAWTYDALAKGQQDTAVRYDGGLTGKAYTNKVTAYNGLYQPTGTQLILPATDPLVADKHVPSTLSFNTSYTLDGAIKTYSNPAVAGLPSEVVTNTYDGLGYPQTTKGTTGYLQDAAYTPLGDLERLGLGTDGATSAKKAYLTYRYEPGTRRLKNSAVTTDVHGYPLQDLNFTQDEAGNVESIFDKANLGGTGKTDYQCFTYDGYRRLAESWTPKTADCATSGRTTTNLDGAAPYWTSYAYTPSGQRKTETQHTATGNATTAYSYGTPAGQPHPVAKTVTGTKTNNYTYDAAGNTISRPGPQATQTLGWNTEGKLVSTSEPATSTNPAQATSYLYDADGELLIRRAKGDGDTVLYLGGTEARLTTKGTTKTLTGTRYYGAAGQNIAVRTSTSGTPVTKLDFLAADHHGTSSLALDGATLAVTSKRYTTPFGNPRGTKSTTWPDDKAFLGKPSDSETDLTHIGAREYDPGIGQFISVDPVLVTDSPQALNGYSYANNTPVTTADPTGMCAEVDCPTRACPTCLNNTPLPTDSPHRTNHGIETAGYVAPQTSGTATAAEVVVAVEQALLDLGPRTDEPTQLAQFWMAYYRVDGGNYWTAPVGDGDRTAMACYGRLACAAAYKHLLETGDVAASKKLAATYCLHNANRCASDAKSYAVASDIIEQAPGLLALGLGRLRPACKCFPAGTDVLMADGSEKNIEEIDVGDEVLAEDPETGEVGNRRITHLIATEDDKHFNKLAIATDGGLENLTATHEHPFWSPSEKRWVEAGQLKRGMTLLTSSGDTVSVRSNRAFDERATTYNLTVDELHTYYVFAGETPILVHNSSCWTATNSKTPMQNALGHWKKHKGDYPQLKNAKQYVEAAKRFMRSEDPWIQLKVRANGDAVRYNRVTEDFGIMTPSGEIRTYYKPDPRSHGYASNQDYFNAQ
ncbi:polymorphic toxin-type HINT domain-containing protein [Streptomyces flavidovirens]|uniref:polymorphic toxin-type HINT domain-containing protein n=1 Tax=Streptomyces flavidovirens TaxID=67298 RepID=UPI0036825654